MNSSADSLGMLTRRQAIRRTVVFSTALLTARWAGPLAAQLPIAGSPGGGMDLLAFGDWGTGSQPQKEVAAQMAAFARKLAVP